MNQVLKQCPTQNMYDFKPILEVTDVAQRGAKFNDILEPTHGGPNGPLPVVNTCFQAQ